MSRAFTILELIVVIVLMGLLAGLLVPRLADGPRRRAELEARQTAALLDDLARRDALSGEAAALTGRRVEGATVLAVEVKRVRGADETPAWARAPLAAPVALTSSRLVEAWRDGAPVGGADDWRIELEPGRPRPVIELRLAMRDEPSGAAGANAGPWTITLGAEAVRATLTAGDGAGPGAPTAPGAVDLDALGQRETPW